MYLRVHVFFIFYFSIFLCFYMSVVMARFPYFHVPIFLYVLHFHSQFYTWIDYTSVVLSFDIFYIFFLAIFSIFLPFYASIFLF